MNEIVHHLERHSYSLLFACVFARQVCLPVPAILFLIAAGALAGNGHLRVSLIIFVSAVASVLADSIWYEAGRLRGNDILHFIQRFSSMPDAAFIRIERQFARYGEKVLLISKLFIGLDAVAPPLAGMSGTSPLRFLPFDMGGAAVWAATYAGLGYAFHSQLDKGVDFAERLGAVLAAAVAVFFAVLIGRRLVHWYGLIQELRLARITPQELKQKLNRGDKVFIVDVEGCVLHHPTATASIPGAVRIDGRRLEQYRDVDVPAEWRTHDVVLYCSCPAEITSARVARLLMQKGVKLVRPLAGGLQAWIDSGFSVVPIDEKLRAGSKS
ncbi:MAG TPA: VTT domain-containing protein [Terriglobales bacterium]|nr:VTT domain-containing protein [Terriglobales bacterium]